ncbi:MAG: hypothetical protein H6755_04440 [Candidatus Omnitrophica bacterium]|nr:hypothetical protein [Candidatus Omnitrophota bacterium]MCB9747639.1 hypothetical protein [Candidatus Omnitrophota bacterium]
MKRIGIAASKIAKGNPVLYNLYVILISSLASFFIFIIAGCMIVFSIVVIAYVSNEIMSFELEKGWTTIMIICMVSLTVVMTIFNLFAILINFKVPRKRSLSDKK